MNTPSDAVPAPPLDSHPVAPAGRSATRPLYWSVRRELWENRSIYIAPLISAGVLLVGSSISAVGLPRRRRAVLLLEPLRQRAHIEIPYDIAVHMIMMTGFLVLLFYCLDALYGERRDRSIFFWKSLPVSDLTTVLSKATIPLVVMPLLTFAITVVTQAIMLLVSTVVLRMNGMSPATPSQLPLFQSWPGLLYALVAMTLWDAPLHGWLLLVSAWSRRAPFLWAMLPPLALVALEKIAFQTTYFAAFLKYRGVGWATEAFASHPRGTLLIDPLNPLAPAKFLSSPGLWLGLAFAVVCLAAAARLRRYRGPL
jgi:ABC-2 type transport system permease protein